MTFPCATRLPRPHAEPHPLLQPLLLELVPGLFNPLLHVCRQGLKLVLREGQQGLFSRLLPLLCTPCSLLQLSYREWSGRGPLGNGQGIGKSTQHLSKLRDTIGASFKSCRVRH